ncbi:MAG: 50S ribosomal protein L23 [Candidatus Altiarchaeales archaeon]|nr:50S ribosomal protein L23 [Candidatus Altiarchaeales archaeon]MBD3416336.1 50S ribosomal protein L23 [Candidatus Altiarchaeales archaeon]
MEPHEILLYPLMGEKATTLRERENMLTFIVSKESTKKEIREAVEKMLKVRVSSVNVMHTVEGKKKAHIRLDKKHSADEIASQMGVL